MNARTQITLMSPEPSLAAAVSAALQSNGHVLSGPAARDLRDLSAQLGRAPVPIVLIDLDPHPQQVLPHLERLIARFPSSRFVALSSTAGSDLLLEAMQSGVRRVVVKQAMAAELPGILDRLTAAEGHAGAAGELVTILSASGGCGATTLAVNLADEIALKRKQPTLLLDFDCAYGAITSYLGLSPRYAADHILHYGGDIDAQLIRSTATVHNDRLHVLASPASVNAGSATPAEPLRFDRLEQVLGSARRAYGVTIVDAPRLALDATAQLVSQSAAALLVFQLTVKDLRTARAMLDALRGGGIDCGSVLPVANRWVKRQLISLEEGRKALGDIAITTIRNDYSSAIHGWNFGQTMAEAGPRSYLRRDLQELLTKLEPRVPASV